jgi:Ca-activated chloride channel family protein
MLVWASSWAFFLFVPLASVVVFLIWRARRGRPTLQFSSLAFAKVAKPSLRARLKWLPTAFFISGLACAIVALARPQKSDTKVKRNVEGIDIMLTLDISDSMVIEDMPPMANRIEAAKSVLTQFVKRRTNDRMGFVVFMGEAFTRVPLTLDHALLLQSIKDVEISRNIKMGTAIGSALATAVGRIKDSTAKTRVIVLATDGENNTGTIDPETALEIAKGFAIRIYTIGIGKDGESQLPTETVDVFGRKVKRYVPIHSSINDDLLGRMASETGGKYYRATDGNAFEKIFKDIDQLEKTKIDVNQFTKYAELFPSWVSAAVVLLMLGISLGQTVWRRLP